MTQKHIKLVSEADLRNIPWIHYDTSADGIVNIAAFLAWFNSLSSEPEVDIDSKGLPRGLIADLMVAADLVRNKQVSGRLVNYANLLTSYRPEVGTAVAAWEYERATEVSDGLPLGDRYGGFERKLSFNKPKDHPQFRNASPLFRTPRPDRTAQLEARIAAIESEWCKEGETIEQRLQRERNDTTTTIGLLAKEQRKVAQLEQQRDLFASGIAEIAVALGITDGSVDLSGTQLLMLVDNIKESIRNNTQLEADNKRLVEAFGKLLGEAKTLAKLAKHAPDCLVNESLPTGIGTWGCTCGLNDAALDSELLNDTLYDALLAEMEAKG